MFPTTINHNKTTNTFARHLYSSVMPHVVHNKLLLSVFAEMQIYFTIWTNTFCTGQLRSAGTWQSSDNNNHLILLQSIKCCHSLFCLSKLCQKLKKKNYFYWGWRSCKFTHCWKMNRKKRDHRFFFIGHQITDACCTADPFEPYESVWIRLNMLQSTWICLNTFEYY